MKKKATKKRIFPTAKQGGALPFLPMLGALGSLIYFDSFGNLRPPKELVRYFGNGATTIEYNCTYYQSFCGQMCLQFLQTVDAREFKKLDEML